CLRAGWRGRHHAPAVSRRAPSRQPGAGAGVSPVQSAAYRPPAAGRLRDLLLRLGIGGLVSRARADRAGGRRRRNTVVRARDAGGLPAASPRQSRLREPLALVSACPAAARPAAASRATSPAAEGRNRPPRPPPRPRPAASPTHAPPPPV